MLDRLVDEKRRGISILQCKPVKFGSCFQRGLCMSENIMPASFGTDCVVDRYLLAPIISHCLFELV